LEWGRRAQAEFNRRSQYKPFSAHGNGGARLVQIESGLGICHARTVWIVGKTSIQTIGLARLLFITLIGGIPKIFFHGVGNLGLVFIVTDEFDLPLPVLKINTHGTVIFAGGGFGNACQYLQIGFFPIDFNRHLALRSPFHPFCMKDAVGSLGTEKQEVCRYGFCLIKRCL
jgi:hypothetical protein